MSTKFIKGFTWSKATIFVFLLTLILIILSQANPSSVIPNRDNGSFLYSGRIIFNGGLPYQDIWDSKPPAIFYINALGLWAGMDSHWGVWLIELLFLSLSSFIGYSLLKQTWGVGSAIVGSFLWLWGLLQVFVTGNLIEEYPLLFNFLALFFFLKSIRQPNSSKYYDLLIGCTAGLSFLFRANNIGVQVSISLAILIGGIYSKQLLHCIKRLLLIFLGVVIPVAFVVVYFNILGIFSDMVNAAIFYNFFYIGGSNGFFDNIMSAFTYLNIAAWGTLLSYLAVVYSFIKSCINRQVGLLSLLLLISWPIEVVFSSVSGRGYEHYFVNWLPAICLTGGFLYYQLSKSVRNNFSIFIEKWHPIILMFMTLVLVALNFNALSSYKHSINVLFFDRSRGIEILDPVSEYIKTKTNDDDKVLVWGGQSGINFLSHRESNTAFQWYPLYRPSPITQKLTDGYYQDLLHNPPELIIDAFSNAPADVPSLDSKYRKNRQVFNEQTIAEFPSNLDKVIEYIDNNYQREERIGEYGIYRRKDNR